MTARLGKWVTLAAALVVGPACSDGAAQGEVFVLTYNVAGLPQGLSSSNPVRNIPLISPMLNAFDLVLVQEDFWYQDQLRKDVTLPHKSTPLTEGDFVGLGDGLNRFSRFPWRDFARVPFALCSGADCGARKGVSVALTELGEGAEADVYNLHFQAGGSADAELSRKNHVDVLLGTIRSRSAGRALLVAGDFNLRRSDGAHDAAMLDRLRDEGGLTLLCEALACGEDRIDRIYYRNSATVTWSAVRRTVETRFVDDKGADLSDHKALSGVLRWSVQ